MKMETLWHAYVNSLNNASLLAQAELFEKAELIRTNGLTAEQIRDVMLRLYPAIVAKYGNLAAVAAAGYFEKNRLAALGIDEPAMVSDVPNMDQLESSVRYAAGDLWELGTDVGLDVMANYLAGAADKAVKEAAHNTIAANTRADRKKGRKVRYARIPDGSACEFCNMLGSRGFVYHSKELAGGNAWHGTQMDTYHPYCNCQVAVAYDTALDDYWVGMTRVTRGYGNGRVVSTGKDRSTRLRDVDIDGLYDEYLGFKDKFSYKSKAVNTKANARKATRRSVNSVPTLKNAETWGDVLGYVDSARENSSDIEYRYGKAIDWASLHNDQQLVNELKQLKEQRLAQLRK